jgi:hypothetical protein
LNENRYVLSETNIHIHRAVISFIDVKQILTEVTNIQGKSLFDHPTIS